MYKIFLNEIRKIFEIFENLENPEKSSANDRNYNNDKNRRSKSNYLMPVLVFIGLWLISPYQISIVKVDQSPLMSFIEQLGLSSEGDPTGTVKMELVQVDQGFRSFFGKFTLNPFSPLFQ